mmetsp:Transcript_18467/g.62286  ORF Transcript_18467/g.62286 Transcript_18467/m.62286 type:complete len:229 (-) Transcript_18467:496-1182(-)
MFRKMGSGRSPVKASAAKPAAASSSGFLGASTFASRSTSAAARFLAVKTTVAIFSCSPATKSQSLRRSAEARPSTAATSSRLRARVSWMDWQLSHRTARSTFSAPRSCFSNASCSTKSPLVTCAAALAAAKASASAVRFFKTALEGGFGSWCTTTLSSSSFAACTLSTQNSSRRSRATSHGAASATSGSARCWTAHASNEPQATTPSRTAQRRRPSSTKAWSGTPPRT